MQSHFVNVINLQNDLLRNREYDWDSTRQCYLAFPIVI